MKRAKMFHVNVVVDTRDNELGLLDEICVEEAIEKGLREAGYDFHICSDEQIGMDVKEIEDFLGGRSALMDNIIQLKKMQEEFRRSVSTMKMAEALSATVPILEALLLNPDTELADGDKVFPEHDERVEFDESSQNHRKLKVKGQDCTGTPYAVNITEVISAAMEKALPPNKEERPSCYKEEQNNPYPLCEGNGTRLCSQCSVFKDYDSFGAETRRKNFADDVLKEVAAEMSRALNSSSTYVIISKGNDGNCELITANPRHSDQRDEEIKRMLENNDVRHIAVAIASRMLKSGM